MSNNTKAIADTLRGAPNILRETLAMRNEIDIALGALGPWDAEAKKNHKNLASFFLVRKKNLSEHIPQHLTLAYPTLTSFISNGLGEGPANRRFVNAIYRLGKVVKDLRARDFMVKTNADCAALSEDLRDIYADLTVFIITQFQLHRDDDAVYLSIIEFCNAQKITPTVFYGSLLNDLERVGREIYAWEPSSAYYDSLLLFDPVLVAECEEAMYPLSSAEAEALLEGSLGLAVMRGKLAEHLSGQIEDDPLELTPGTFVEKLELN